MLKKLSTKQLTALADVKAHLRVDHTEEDDLINSYIDLAHNFVEDYTSIGFGVQNFEEHLTPDLAEDSVYLSMNPLGAISEVVEINETTGEEVVITDYVTIKNGLGARIKVDANRSYKVSYSAGLDLGDCPKQMHQAVLLMVGELYENRESRVKQRRSNVEYLLNQVAIKRV